MDIGLDVFLVKADREGALELTLCPDLTYYDDDDEEEEVHSAPSPIKHKL